MAKARTDKVVCYIVKDGHLLVFTHCGHPLEETGVQVPAGTIKPTESPAQAALREGTEETGLTDLRVVRMLGECEYDISPYRHEIMRRHFYELTTDTGVGNFWNVQEHDAAGDGGAPLFRLHWIPLSQAHVLAGGLSVMIGALVAE